MADPNIVEVFENVVHIDNRSTVVITPASNGRKPMKKRSKAWDEFLVIDPTENTNGKPRALCSHCKTTSFIADSHYGTSNMNEHLKKCQPYQEFLKNTGKSKTHTFDQTYYRDLVSRAIIKHGYAFSWVEHEGNREIHTYLNHQVRTITRNTAKADCLKLHSTLKGQLIKTLKSVPGRISLTADMWTSCQTEGYLCLTAHYVDASWKLNSRVLNFCHIEAPHTGHEMYSVVSKLLKEWGIEHKIFSITLDNASSNEKMQDYLRNTLNSRGLLVSKGRFFHIRCAAHILNLIVKSGLSIIEHSIEKIRRSVKYVKWSEVRKQAFHCCVNLAGISETKALWLDVPTRWNSTYMMLDRAVLYRNAFKELDSKDCMYLHFPTFEEWEKIEKIKDILEPFLDITELFSGSDYPTSNLYFENVWRIAMLLKELADSSDQDLRSMALAMIAKFDKYWFHSDLDDDEHDDTISEHFHTLFAFSVILDPRYKKQFLKFCYQKIFEDDKKATLEVESLSFKLEKLLDEYSLNGNTSVPASPASNSTHTRSSRAKASNRKRKFDLIDFDNEELTHMCSAKTKLNAYLDDPRIDRNKELDILYFWKENEKQYGELSYLARDILSVPLTTVASESTFSIGGRILNKWRSSYLPENIEALITSRSWLYGYEAIEEEEFTGSEVNWNAGTTSSGTI